MRTTILAAIACSLLTATSALAQNPVQTLTQNNAATVTNWYTQNVPDPTDTRRGNIVKDPLAGRSDRAAPVTVGVGGLIGLGEKEITVPDSVLNTENNTGPARLQ